jgi:hypothetical protein
MIDAALREQFLSALATGVGVGVAASFAGIGRSTAHGWLARGEKEAAARVTAETSEFVAFLDGVTRTRAGVQVNLAARMMNAVNTGKGDGKLALAMLERLAPSDWCVHKTTVQNEHQQDGSIAMELLGGRQPVDIPLEKRERIIALLEEADTEAEA